MKIANPIYDVVFKYLMEDERIARTILSALLKKDVVGVEMRAHEYSNDVRDALSVFRIDFGATVRDDEGNESMILVELQKTWVETETLRFRQYLGVQYRSPRNMRGDYAVPMVAVYLLGHKVGAIEEPVLYVSHDCRDYYERRVEKGMPDPFVESLTHDSIIVQIPRLHEQINNRLDKVLSIFDQTRRDSDDEQLLSIDERAYTDDSAMERILHRLTMAAADAAVRHRMDVEDEYFSIIEKRDTEILMKDKRLAEQNVMLAEKDSQLQEKDSQLQEKDSQLQDKDSQLQEKDSQLQEKDSQLQEKDSQLQEKDSQLQEKDLLLRRSVSALKTSMSMEQVAATLGISMDDVERLAKD